ncbi:hypothetical protein NHX12_030611 [Muraenolepis orangiensis]|uniref:Uncharacterized protein n=1 Tax=Muraenolepis orangiensis TaxID=630683 RepID=A0A9Q0EBM6_9TELE|nr:hypothetical protein NHX12_030611 [Muraenolepis orangiensis]
MVGHSALSFGLICLIGSVFSVPFKGFGSNNPSPALGDFSGPGEDALVYTSGRKSQDYTGPSTWSQQSSDQNAEQGGNSQDGSETDAGDSGWANNGGLNTGSEAYYPIAYDPQGNSEDLLTSTDEDLEEEPVLSDVSDLEPVYSFSTRITWLLWLIGGVVSLPVDKGFGSHNRSPVLTDSLSPSSPDTNVGGHGCAYTSPQDGNSIVGPLTWIQHSRNSNSGAGVYNSIMDGGEDYYLEENPTEFVWINVFDLEPGYSFGYQQGGQVFIQSN